jgi:peptidoglycan/xylan/chitin deacetylase (PgdA/CDA1 family)
MTSGPWHRRDFLKLTGAVGFTLGTILHFPARAAAQQAVVRVECPILTYHEVASRATFGRQIARYLDGGYQPISVAQLGRILGGEDVPLWGKPFVITFDDGLKSQKDNALPFLVERQVPAVFAVMADWQGDRRHSYMSNDDFRRLVGDYGLEVISHTFHHTNLVRERTRNLGSWQAQIVGSRYRLEEIVGNGYQVEAFCFPFGAYDGPTLDLVGQHYGLALSTRAGTTQRSDELLTLRRTSMS